MVDATHDIGRDSPVPRTEPIGALLIFYIAIPVTMALLLGASSSGSGRFAERWAYFAYPMTGSVPSWILNWAATWLATIILRPWRPHLLVVTTIGAIASLHLSGPITLLRHFLFTPYLLPGAHFYSTFPWRYNDPHFVMEAAIVWLTSSLTWGTANAFWVFFLGYSRFGYRSAGVLGREVQVQAPPPPASTPLTSRLPASVARDVVALRAEQHYTRVYSRAGDVLILIRFSDAIQSLGANDGLQVHRSYWVRPSAVKTVERANGSYRLEMVNGLAVPVGRSFKREVDNAGLGALARA